MYVTRHEHATSGWIALGKEYNGVAEASRKMALFLFLDEMHMRELIIDDRPRLVKAKT